MKKVINFLFLLIIFPTTLNSKNHQIFEQIEKKNLIEFNKLFKKVCNTQTFFKNLVSHSSYPEFGSKESWEKLCVKIKKKKLEKDVLIKEYFQIKILSKIDGKLTGYYEPKIKVSRIKTESFSIPILKYNKKFSGMKRSEINKQFRESDVLLWTDDKIDFFFLQIQGSGLGVFENGEKIKILYNGNNNLKYTSIGNVMIRKSLLNKKEVNLFTIKKYLRKNPDRAINILNENDRYIFFKITPHKKNFPKGAFGINLIPNVSIAVDKKYYPLGIPILYKEEGSKTFKPAFALDTGAAIKGKNRADLFTGNGKKAEKIAGMLKKKLLLYTLVPYSD